MPKYSPKTQPEAPELPLLMQEQKPADVTPAPMVNIPGLNRLADEEYAAAHRENKQRNFVDDVMKARNPVVKEYVPPPIPEGVQRRTNEEMKAGQEAVARRAAEEALRPKHRPDPSEARMTPVFRPHDYVPDIKKNQGQTQNRTLT